MFAGVRLRSRFEADIYSDAVRRGLDVTYEPDRFTYTTPHVYRPDFRLPNGVYVEAKGYFPTTDRTKMLSVRESNPDLDLRLLFQTASTKLRRGSRTTYAQWAEQHGFQWAEGPSIPAVWLEEVPR